MPLFYDADSVHNLLEKEVIKALTYTAREIQRRLRVLILEEIYSVYHPDKYPRLYEILNSVEVVPVEKSGDEWIIEVRFKNTKHTNKSWYDAEGAGIHKGDYVTLPQIMEAIAEGEAKMGTYGTEIDIMEMGYEEWIVQRKALKMIIDYLKDNFDITWS
jgi:hypothetical protein